MYSMAMRRPASLFSSAIIERIKSRTDDLFVLTRSDARSLALLSVKFIIKKDFRFTLALIEIFVLFF